MARWNRPALAGDITLAAVLVEPADWPLWLGEVEGDPATLLQPAPDHTLALVAGEPGGECAAQ